MGDERLKKARKEKIRERDVTQDREQEAVRRKNEKGRKSRAKRRGARLKCEVRAKTREIEGEMRYEGSRVTNAR